MYQNPPYQPYTSMYQSPYGQQTPYFNNPYANVQNNQQPYQQQQPQMQEQPQDNYVTLQQFTDLLQNFDDLKKEFEKLKSAKPQKAEEKEVKK